MLYYVIVFCIFMCLCQGAHCIRISLCKLIESLYLSRQNFASAQFPNIPGSNSNCLRDKKVRQALLI